MKIVMIGPVYPYKGGISHYTSLMYKALSSRNHDVKMISYRLQYPKLLYKKEQKDYTNDSLKVAETSFIINTVNPLSWIGTAKYIKKENPDLVIVQWWHPYFAPCYWILAKLLKRKKLLFLCHNVFPHERFPFDRFITKRVLSQGNYFIVQSNKDAFDLTSIKPNAIYKVAVHPTYSNFRFENMSKSTAREKLGLSFGQKVLLFFGFVREYKGLKHLLRALPKITAQYKDCHLMIVGDFGIDKQSYLDLINELKLNEYINIYDSYIPDREIEKYFAASDLVVLPYESATQSGIVQIAYGFGKAVVATNVGGLPEVVLDNKTGYIVEPQNPEQIANAVICFFKENKMNEFAVNIANEADKYSWDRMVEKVEGFMKEKHHSLSHAILDKETRTKKAKKIELLVKKYTTLKMDTMLEVGSGSGFIAHYFSELGYGEKGTFVVDVVDERKVTDGFNYQLIQNCNLPFADNKFDFIISNHVIEHVGDLNAQITHLREIYRTLIPNGVFYFAVPNRWRFVEGHYKLPFLSWLPKSLSSKYLRLMGKGDHYDCNLLSRSEAEKLLNEQGFSYIDATIDAIRIIGEIESQNPFVKFTSLLPKRFWRMFMMFMPTLIYICRKPTS